MLTGAKVRASKPREKPYKLTDERGLMAVSVQPNGARWWRLRYRYNGREKMISLGTYPDTSLAIAREKRDEARRLPSKGIDPSAARQAERDALANTFEAIAREWLAASCPGGKGRGITEGTVAQLKHRLVTYVFPYVGRWPITDVTAPELLKVLRRIEAKGTLETAHRVRSVASRVFKYAIATGRAERDAASDLKGVLKPADKKSFAAVTDPRRLGVMLRAIDQYAGQPVTKCALQFLALTFVRPGELRLATWGELDLEGKEPQWIIPAERTKMRRAHIVPLAPQAVAILDDLRPLTDRGPDSLVFPSLRPGRPLSENTLNMALRTLGFDGNSHVAHGFRSSASTLLHERGYLSEVIETQLAHARPGVGGVYNRSHLLKQRRKLVNEWADYLDGLKAGASVTAIRGAAK
jgi:integrase